MQHAFSRTELLLGADGLQKLAAARVAVFGIGGVGGYTVEALARSGIGTLDIVDDDTVAISNINRQIIATTKTVGQRKVDVMAARIYDINPNAVVNKHACFYLPETAGQFCFEDYDYIVDAVDTVTAKLDLIQRAQAAGIPIISAMGAGNKLDPTKLRIGDISQTEMCPLARIIRKELRKRGIRHLKVVYSTEEALRPQADVLAQHAEAPREGSSRRATPGSLAVVPSVAGLFMAGEIIRELLEG